MQDLSASDNLIILQRHRLNLLIKFYPNFCIMKMNDSGKGPQKKTWANFVGEINFLKLPAAFI